MKTSLWLYQLITLQLLFRFPKTKIASTVTVSGNSTVLCFQTKIMLQKQKTLFKLSKVSKILFRMSRTKYGIQKFTCNYSKKLVKEQKESKTLLKNKLKELEGNLNTEDNIQSYNIYKKELDSRYYHVTEGQNVTGVTRRKVHKVFF